MSQPIAAPEPCSQCLKPVELCVCASVRKLSTRHHVLILQHPQEPDKELGTARLAHLALPNSTLRVGLSWPNLKKALGQEVEAPSRWAVLYLGSGVKPDATMPPKIEKPKPLRFVTKAGLQTPKPKDGLDGIVVLDGTWSQAKTLWWRNAWLLKLQRVVLTPQGRSLYRELRKEPRRECLSTIESIGQTLAGLGEKPEVEQGLNALFGELLEKQRTRLKERKKSARSEAERSASTS